MARFKLPDLNFIMFAVLSFILFYGFATQAQSVDIQMEKKLRKEHPRLIFTNDAQERIEVLSKQNPILQRLIDALFDQANQYLSEPTIKYEIVGTRGRLLHQSRACLAKVFTLATAYRLSHDHIYAHRAIKEMRTATAFPDWNPGHFLDVGEMSTALAIGYDWLFDILSEEDKLSIKNALIEFGIKPGLHVHPDRFPNKINNWNFVCNGGLIMAALAIGDEEPVLAQKIISKSLASLPNALRSYAPDGAWFEGPSYWMYGTSYLTMLLASLGSALGDDFGISKSSGLNATGRFFMDAIGPSGKFFNYADCRIKPRSSVPALNWLAQRFKQPLLAWFNRQLLHYYYDGLKGRKFKIKDASAYNRFFPLEIIWFVPDNNIQDTFREFDTFYRGLNDVAFFRSSNTDNALWVGFKAGKNSINHAHLDCGNFVFEAVGQRWAEDLGSENYNLPGYFDRTDGGQRWKYFRTSSLSHNIPTINNQNQNFNSFTKIIASHSSPERSHAVADLSSAYEGQAKSVTRGIAVLNREVLLIQDEVVGLKPGDLFRWAMLTSAKITLDGNRAELQIEDSVISAEIIQPMNAIFDTASTRPTYHADERPNPGTCLFTVSVPLKIDTLITVAIELKQKVKEPSHISHKIKITPLSKWIGHFEKVNE